jgi:hypothetical protein
MKIYLFLAFLLTVASAFCADAMKFVSPNKLSIGQILKTRHYRPAVREESASPLLLGSRLNF